ncbi:C-C motif chemokine 27a [Hippoglossus hippoglossus]|uniref:C-C motif chemokine 27a n=1 Tax=Hippoglossus hippoglossus TaxID=8267 RepID=UPI00148D9B31|nr:C-C motif chemokine 27a [Hippoglossus hippoglossus]
MDLKVAFVVVCLFALAITSTEAVIPKCCMKTAAHVNKHWLMKVEKWYVQQSSGACDISALILYVKGQLKPICAPLKVKTLLKSLQKRRKRHNVKAAF